MGSSRVPTPYQIVHLIKLLANGSGGLLVCDGVGVGKTISAGYIVAFHHMMKKGDIAIVCPPVLTQKWRLELREKFGLPTVPITNPEALTSMVEETSAHADAGESRVYVIPYSLLSRIPLDSSPLLSLVILDEIHTLRNPQTQTFSSAAGLVRLAKHRVGLTATPVHNRLDDLASELSILFPQYDLDVLKVVIPEIWLTKKTSFLHPWTTRFLKDMLKVHFTRRNVENRLVRYPEDYARQVEDLLEQLKRAPGIRNSTSRLDMITRFRLAASSPVAFFNSIGKPNPFPSPDSKAQRLLEILGTAPDVRWLVFCDFVDTAKSLGSLIQSRPVFLMTGETDTSEREALTNGFRDKSNAVLILTSVGSEGLDFQVASHLVNYDLHWNPMVLEQRIGRIDRIGQKSSDIHVYNFIVDGSIDERVVNVLGRKLALVSGTFADPGPIISPTRHEPVSLVGGRLVSPDENLVEEEMGVARSLVESESLVRQLPSMDYELARVLPPELCDLSRWPTDARSWEDGVRWLPRDSAVLTWSSELSKAASQLEEFLSHYQ